MGIHDHACTFGAFAQPNNPLSFNEQYLVFNNTFRGNDPPVFYSYQNNLFPLYQRMDELLGISVLWIFQDLVGETAFDDSAVEHDDSSVSQHANHCQVV